MLIMLVSLTACSGKPTVPANPADEPQGAINTPDPIAGLDAGQVVPFPSEADLESDIPGRATSTPDIQIRKGSERTSMSANAAVNGDFLDLAAAAGEYSYGIFRFDSLVDEDIPQLLQVEFAAPLPDTYYVGLADFAIGAWRWYTQGSAHMASTSETGDLNLSVGPDYISHSGRVFATIVMFNDASATLYSVSLTSEIHDEAPVAACTATPSKGNASLSVYFDATASTDKGGAGIVEYRFDWDGDGVDDLVDSNATQTHAYPQRGSYSPLVTVADGSGLEDTIELSVIVSGWIHSWGQLANDIVEGICTDLKGDVYAVGKHSNGTAQENGLLIAKYDRFGEPLWFKTWVTDAYEHLYAVQRMADGSLLAVGTTESVGAGSSDVLIVNFNPAGDVLGAWTWGGALYDAAHDVQIEDDGSIYLTGGTTSFGESNGPNVLTLKLDSEMNVLWARSWGPDYPDNGQRIRLDNDGNAYVLVRSESFNQPRAECVLLKYAPNGPLVWSQRYYMASHIIVVGMDLDWLGNAYIVGSDDSMDDKLLLLKFSNAGDLLLEKTWDAGYRALGADVIVSGGFMSPIRLRITGDTYGATSDKDLLYLKMDNNAVPEIEKALIAPGFQDGMCINFGKSGELLMGGWAQDNSGVWLDVPGTVANASGTLVTAAAPTTPITGSSVTAQPVTLSDVAGVHDTGGGGTWDAVVMSYFEDDL